MDPLTALLLTTKAIAEMVTEVVRGQTPEQKRKMWDWYIADVERWRKLFHLDDQPAKVRKRHRSVDKKVRSAIHSRGFADVTVKEK